MDNFGAGYSLLSSLNSFVFDRVKIDRSFIPEIDRGNDALSTLSAVAGLGKRPRPGHRRNRRGKCRTARRCCASPDARKFRDRRSARHARRRR
ncbi:MAG: hypothetical protein MZV49_25965 [Rhodopseudomonas palustris]|nr:hypothetical protein [Rhodopseudomonas palustris]